MRLQVQKPFRRSLRRILVLLLIGAFAGGAWKWMHRPLPFSPEAWSKAVRNDASIRNRMMPDLRAMFEQDRLSDRTKVLALLGKPDAQATILWQYRLGKAPRIGATSDDWLVIRFGKDNQTIDWRVNPG